MKKIKKEKKIKKPQIKHHCLCECDELNCGYICVCEPETICIACSYGRMEPCEIDDLYEN